MKVEKLEKVNMYGNKFCLKYSKKNDRRDKNYFKTRICNKIHKLLW